MNTIEQKAKAYDESIKKAMELWNSPRTCFDIEQLKSIFPKLRESEDERIRKDIVKHFEKYQKKCFLSKTMPDLVIPDALAYLERQKENSLSLVDAWKEMRTEVFAQASGNKPKPESDEFTKLFSLNDIDFLISDLDSRGIKQKPAEKQDYSGLNDLERAIHRGFLCAGVENVPVGIIKETAQDCLAHMPTWSEEDKKNLKRAIQQMDFLEEYIDDDGSFVTVAAKQSSLEVCRSVRNWLEERLKYLRPSWKPSEEQIQAIIYLASSIPPNFLKEQEYTMRLVDEVISNLKKL